MSAIDTVSTPTLELVREAIANSIDVEIDEVSPAQTLFGDLELESIDLLDVFFRIEQANGVHVTADDLAAHLQGGIPDDDFSDNDDVITDRGLTHLEGAIPGFSRAQLSAPLRAEAILDLVTVETLAAVVTDRMAE